MKGGMKEIHKDNMRHCGEFMAFCGLLLTLKSRCDAFNATFRFRCLFYWILLLLSDLPRVVLQPQRNYFYHNHHYNHHYNDHTYHTNHSDHYHHVYNNDNYDQYLPLNLVGRVRCPIDSNPADYIVLWFRNNQSLKTSTDPRVKVCLNLYSINISSFMFINIPT